MSLADAFERAAAALPAAADALRDANGDADRALEALAPDQASRVLAWLLENAPDEADEVAELWASREEGARALAGVDETALGKAARKLLRRARHRLRSRGVEVEAPAPAARVARVPGGAEELLEHARVSPFDPTGARLVTLVTTPPSGGALLVQVVTDSRRGILECQVYETTRGRARRYTREAANRDRFAGAEVGLGEARAWIARMLARQASDRPLPREFVRMRSHLLGQAGTDAARDETPGERARRELGAEGSPRRAVELVREHVIGPWLPPGEALEAVAERLQELQKGSIIVSGAARQEQVASILDEALESTFDAAEAARVAEWLEETAFVLWQEDREDDARACLAAAAGERPHAEVLRAILEVALTPLLARLREDQAGEGAKAAPEPDAGSLVVKP